LFVTGQGGGMVHTRLSILDLSPAGHQPMSTPDGRYTIVFNGEIYNFRELRSRLEKAGGVFRSQSDTEVILQLYAQRGAACVKELQGMFAFAIWDRDEQTCFLARDPLGIKPLYYCELGQVLGFGSEVSALLSADLIPRRISRLALEGYLLYGSVPEPYTLIEGIQCLPAGHYLHWRKGQSKIKRYWEVAFHSAPAVDDAAWQTRQALLDSVSRHFVSDVPVSIFLSGGVDSTALVALAQQLHHPDLRTFCISFDTPELNEGDVAARTARYFGTDHYDLRLDAATGKKLLRSFLDASDQPSIDGFNTYCVSKHAHEHGAKVVLSGLGGDEVFGGYQSFEALPRLMNWNRRMERWFGARELAGTVLSVRRNSAPVRRLRRFLQSPGGPLSAYWCIRGIFTPEEAGQLAAYYAPGTEGSYPEFDDSENFIIAKDVADEVSRLELTWYMRNQLLKDSDVMSMAWGLELRVPFVDQPFIDAVSGIPAPQRLQSGKRLLLEAVPEIPDWVAGQPKRGFVFPFKQWMEEEWGEFFQQVNSKIPVPTLTWYRSWCLFALENFLRKVGLA
jgi:asparagine synthase (glutamine-hydrolysing)